MDTLYDGLDFPRTETALKALRFAKRVEHAAAFNHSMRTYLYGRFVGEREGLLPGRDYDDELLFLGCVLHDVGLSAEGDGDQRFDIDGADLAARFLTEQGLPEDRVEVVWDAIALHLCFDVARRKRPEIALVTTGAGYDLGVDARHPLPDGYADRVHAVLPRLHAAAVLHDEIIEQGLAKPGKAPMFSLPGELVRQHTGKAWPTWEQLARQDAGWGDYDGYAGSVR
ncbi:HD domain-containing protein [Nocardiopsis gilva YIM 90087]|uniref:HD domain-containing protein n=1 Tax=Nocardiopsis gilva YIM 90087 TaxID=1235441 RepID=A0A223S1G7_9ACTN|nr:HD domain-containing protein [Nocardiopsis gilva]ASU81958.1 HD domain-containing protein [Nocardiopsis gilva YIM 90087]